ncbi:MAG: aconitase X [bacterium]
MNKGLQMYLNQEEEQILNGDFGPGAKKALQILIGMGEARGAEKMVEISYAHLMPPDVMFFPYGKQGKWGQELMEDMIKGTVKLRVPTTIEPKFVDLTIAKELEFSNSEIEEMNVIMGQAVQFYEKLGVIPTYSAMPFFVYPGKLNQHVSIAESISILWYNTIFGSRCERDDGVISLSAAITGRVPFIGMHQKEERYAQIIVRLGDELNYAQLTDSDFDALSLAVSRRTKEKIPVITNFPQELGRNYTKLKHLLATIAVESGLPLLHMVGITPEAPNIEAALGPNKNAEEIIIGKDELNEAYEIACTAKDEHIDYVLLGCPHVTMSEMQEIIQVLDGKKLDPNVKLIISTTKLFKDTAEDMGWLDILKKAGAIVTDSMCIAFAGTRVSGTIATNSIKGAFFYSGFDQTKASPVWFGSTRDCAMAALHGKWIGGIRKL